MKKKRRLKKWVKVTLNWLGVIAFVGFMYMCLSVGIERYNELGRQCDEYYGYTCSHYQVEQWGKGIRR